MSVGWINQIVRGDGIGWWTSAPSSEFDKHANGSGYRPVPGDIVVFGGDEAGHVAIVEWDNAAQVGVLEQNSSPTGRRTLAWSGNTLGGFWILHVVGFLHAKANVQVPQQSGPYHVTANGVNLYSGPGTQYHVTGTANNGQAATITCQARTSSFVHGSAIWDRLDNGSYVSDYYVSTPNYNQFSPGLAQCAPSTWIGLALRGTGSGYDLSSYGGVGTIGTAPVVDPTELWPGWNIARAIAVRPNASGGYVLDGWGGVHPFGGAPGVALSAYWKGWDIARALALRADGNGGYVLDGWGGVHPFGGAPPAGGGGPYWQGWDIARGIALRSDGSSGYVLDGWGGVHPFGGAPAVQVTAYWPNWDIARAIALRPDGVSGYVLDGWGGIHPFGGAPALGVSRYTQGVDDATSLSLTADGNGGWVLFKDGGIAQFGDAPPIG